MTRYFIYKNKEDDPIFENSSTACFVELFSFDIYVFEPEFANFHLFLKDGKQKELFHLYMTGKSLHILSQISHEDTLSFVDFLSSILTGVSVKLLENEKEKKYSSNHFCKIVINYDEILDPNKFKVFAYLLRCAAETPSFAKLVIEKGKKIENVDALQAYCILASDPSVSLGHNCFNLIGGFGMGKMYTNYTIKEFFEILKSWEFNVVYTNLLRWEGFETKQFASRELARESLIKDSQEQFLKEQKRIEDLGKEIQIKPKSKSVAKRKPRKKKIAEIPALI